MTRTTPESALPLQTSTPHQREEFRPTMSNLRYTRTTYKADFQWYRVSNLDLPIPKSRPYHEGHRGPECLGENIPIGFNYRKHTC
ncbi:hypothetical protein AVEN_267976-1 [Araneus ventricosus]|uniref:Uncharacterized protein n=1 Tax=Araneus ventricosus TaxID=182803 RepID=A0A4Y2IWT1_ARAVE|nr:hypothetical protein AVEN_267976-1 [Araneus ventricosus]